MSKLVIGCGYVGRPLAKLWAERGEDVWVTTRTPQRADQFAAEGLKPLVLDVTDTTINQLPAVDTIVFAVGYDRSGPHPIHDVYVEGLRNVLSRHAGNPQKLIYLSSTGVYGNSDGDWVDEDSPCEPTRDGGKACLAAEQYLRTDPFWGDRSIILRLAGIYGPDRLPQAAILQRGEPLKVAAAGTLNLVHLDDILQIIDACVERIAPPELFCVSDGNSVQRSVFYEHLAELLQCDPPRFAPPAEGSSRAARARGSKRVSNDRLQQRVAPVWKYPSFREGLAGIVARDL